MVWIARSLKVYKPKDLAPHESLPSHSESKDSSDLCTFQDLFEIELFKFVPFANSWSGVSDSIEKNKLVIYLKLYRQTL